MTLFTAALNLMLMINVTATERSPSKNLHITNWTYPRLPRWRHINLNDSKLCRLQTPFLFCFWIFICRYGVFAGCGLSYCVNVYCFLHFNYQKNHHRKLFYYSFPVMFSCAQCSYNSSADPVVSIVVDSSPHGTTAKHLQYFIATFRTLFSYCFITTVMLFFSSQHFLQAPTWRE